MQAGRRAVGKSSREVPYHAIPWSIFTSPEIATVGMNETMAEAEDRGCRTAVVPLMSNIKVDPIMGGTGMRANYVTFVREPGREADS